jgi:16S rRNA (adenine1518-N6/adenine1519-N6)-dimethyltransferase
MTPSRSSLLSTTKEVLYTHGIKPTKGLGQNFLVDAHVLKKLVASAEIKPRDTVLEIGPGIGVLTQELAQQARQVLAIEKDSAMVGILQETLSHFSNIQLLHGDALKLHTPKNLGAYKIVSNLPYYITAPTMRKFLEAEHKPESITLIVQKEVARRVCAQPPDMSILAVSVQFYAKAKVVSSIKKSSFWPQPKVDSAIIHIVPHTEDPPVEPKKFFKVVKAGFSHPRRQLVNNLAEGLDMKKENIVSLLEKNNMQPQQRAETLGIQDWVALTKDLF